MTGAYADTRRYAGASDAFHSTGAAMTAAMTGARALPTRSSLARTAAIAGAAFLAGAVIGAGLGAALAGNFLP
jgi:hypothetical protein